MKFWGLFPSLLLLLSSAVAAFVPPLPTFRPTLGLSAHKKQQHENSFDWLNELKKRITETHSPYADQFYAPEENHVLPDEFYIVFVQPDTEEQGVHTIEYPAGSGTNVILAFESWESARKFADLLAVQHFVNPQPRIIAMDNLDAFCQQLGVFAQFVPEGLDLIPPSQNVKEFGHDRSLRDRQEHLDYIFAMEETDIFEREGTLEAMGSWD